MTISEHLEELRKRLIRSTVAVLLVFALSWGFVDEVMEVLLQPHYQAMASLEREVDPRPIVTGYTETIGTYLKACLVVSLLVAGPYVLWEIWGFIAAGLYPNEKGSVRRYFPLALLLFLAGIASGYFFMIPIGLKFLVNFGNEIVRTEIRISEYFSLFLTLTFALGLIFQIPVVMTVLSKLGVVKPAAYRKAWRYVIVIAFIASAIITPTLDPVNQSLLALSIYLLYELGILFSRFAYQERQKILEEKTS